MKSEELRHLTASEQLTLQQEYEMQCSWCEDEDSEEASHPHPRQPPFLLSPTLQPSGGITKAVMVKSLEVAYEPLKVVPAADSFFLSLEGFRENKAI